MDDEDEDDVVDWVPLSDDPPLPLLPPPLPLVPLFPLPPRPRPLVADVVDGEAGDGVRGCGDSVGDSVVAGGSLGLDLDLDRNLFL